MWEVICYQKRELSNSFNTTDRGRKIKKKRINLYCKKLIIKLKRLKQE